MSPVVAAAAALVFGYAVGTAPLAWFLVRRRHGIDLRFRPGGTGAAGAFIAGGARTALLVIFLEVLKGAFVGSVVRILGGPGWIAAMAIAGCVVGDLAPLWLQRRGSGIVPLVSGLLIALPLSGIVTGFVAIVAVAFSRPSAAGITAIAVPVGLVLGTGSWLALIPAAIIVTALITLRPRGRAKWLSRALPGRTVETMPPR